MITPLTVHALLLLYDKDAAAVDAWATAVGTALAPYNVKIVHQLALDLQLDKNGIAREHFGFADGLSQPIPFGAEGGEDDTVVLGNGQPALRDPWHGVPLGEILLGHTNAHAEKAPGPLVPDDLLSRDLGSEAGRRARGLLQLRSRTAATWWCASSGNMSPRSGNPSRKTPPGFAPTIRPRRTSRPTGWPSGSSAAPSTATCCARAARCLPPDGFNSPQNAFGFMPQPIRTATAARSASHVRRANPRDGLAKDPASAQTLLDAANNHRILRRGRKYGPPPTDRHTDDGAERGLLFICLNTDIARQFEFVQQTWILNSNFATLFDETDPLVGPKGGFTIREQPLRRIVEVETFIQSAGGEYFFLPSIPALEIPGKPMSITTTATATQDPLRPPATGLKAWLAAWLAQAHSLRLSPARGPWPPILVSATSSW